MKNRNHENDPDAEVNAWRCENCGKEKFGGGCPFVCECGDPTFKPFDL